jgi:hypothetical protein
VHLLHPLAGGFDSLDDVVVRLTECVHSDEYRAR